MKRSIGIYPVDFRLTRAALVLLDPEREKPSVARCIERRADGRGGEEVEIRWEELERIMPSSTEALRVELARSLLDRTPVVLNEIQNFDAGNHDRLVEAFEAASPRAPRFG